MQINFYATLRAAAGGKTLDVPVPQGATVRSVLRGATATRPDLAHEIWQGTDLVYDHIHLLLNGRDTQFLPLGLDMPVSDEDTLDIFPPVGGGSSEKRL